jgi:outer membrane protein assembly factor BamB
MPQRNVLLLLTSLALATAGCARAGEPPASSDREGLAQRLLAAAGVKGGLVVHLGCGDGRLTAALRRSERYLVHGLDSDAAKVEGARKHLLARRLWGPVSVELWKGGRLPYADNLVNLIVLPERSKIPERELRRVLAPGGTALELGGKGGAEVAVKLRKPRPKTIDEWTHFLHGPDNNAVAHDSVVGPPRHLQWTAGPGYTRHHEHVSSITTVVSAGGRLFYVQDEGPRASMFLPPKWQLVARDAFNGTKLWKRAIAPWQPHLTLMTWNSAWVQRTVVARGERVYATLKLRGPASELDAATGKTLRTYESTKGTEEILCAGGRLYLAAVIPGEAEDAAGLARNPLKPRPRRILAIDANSGKLLWNKADKDSSGLLPLTLAFSGGRLFFMNAREVVCLDAASGRVRWRRARAEVAKRAVNVAPTLVAHRDAVFCADQDPKAPGAFSRGEFVALAAADGRELWRRPCAMGWASPADVFVADGLVWIGTRRGRGWIVGADRRGEADFTEGLDPLTGKVRRKLDTAKAFVNRPHHHRCYRDKATDRFLVLGRHGVGFVPLRGGEIRLHDWIRGTCRYGVLPCNGLVYLPPHSCCCHIRSLMTGFSALAPESRHAEDSAPVRPRLERGPAFNSVPKPASPAPGSGEWPTYRCDPARSGATPDAVPPKLRTAWKQSLGESLTAVTVADGRLFLSAAESNTIHCLDAGSGKRLWQCAVGGRVDSPPTIHRGRVIFGSADGRVYCLRASDGALVWRFRAAPRERRIVARDRVESAWPVHGSVLVEEGSVYFAAGRSSNLDGGIHVCRLDVGTGRLLSETVLNSRGQGPDGHRQGLPDVMLSDGKSAWMRFQRFALDDVRNGSHREDGEGGAKGGARAGSPRLICPTGFLDGSWWHRSHWAFGTGVFGVGRRFVYPPTAGRRMPAGQLLVFDEERVFGFGRKPEYFMWTTPVEHRLFAARKKPQVVPLKFEGRQPKQPWIRYPERQIATLWSREVPMHVRAMVLAGKTLCVAGPPRTTKEGPAKGYVRRSRLSPEQAAKAVDAWEGRSGALLWLVSSADGTKLAECSLPSPPIFDGMAASDGKLYLATVDGCVLCMGATEEEKKTK